MQKIIKPSKISGTLFAPSSKSTMQRAIVAAFLADGISEIEFHSLCNDTLSALSMIEDLGAEITRFENKFVIKGGINPRKTTINCGESGLCARMFISVAALCNSEITIEGKGSLVKRNLAILTEEYKTLGMNVQTTEKHLPVKVSGPITGGNIEIDGSSTSQILTGLLMTLPLAPNNSEIKVRNLISKPYIDLTISMLYEFGIQVMNQNYELFKIAGNQKYKPATYISEGDWSGAAFLLVAGALAGEITVRNLSVFSKQADKSIIEALKRCGAKMSIFEDGISVQKNELKSFEFDASECPDLFPPLTALASACSGTSVIKGVNRLPHKESNRAEALKSEFSKMGITIKIEGDFMHITGGKPKSVITESHNDHRIAMAVAVAALLAEDKITINGAESVEKSYIEFWEDLEKISK